MGKVAEMCVMPLSSKSVPGVNAPASDETFLDNRLVQQSQSGSGMQDKRCTVNWVSS